VNDGCIDRFTIDTDKSQIPNIRLTLMTTTSSTSPRLLCLMLRAQHLARAESPASGYAMVVTSIVTLMMFSLLAAALAITNLSKSSTNAYMEGNSTFYAAESGLNKRANELRQRFINYATPDGTSPGQVAGSIAGIGNMSACLDNSPTKNWGTLDFACQQLDLNYNHASNLKVSQGEDGKSLASTDASGNVKYTAFTFASDRTVYTDTVRKIPQVVTVPSGQAFAGLNAQEYRYTIYSFATSKQDGNLDARANTVLEMTFKSRVIPLFQFAAFYNDDLEMNSTSPMNINGRIHTNGNLYAQPTPIQKFIPVYDSKGKKIIRYDPDPTQTANTRLLAPVTVAGKIYNRVDAATIARYGDTQVLLSGDPENPNAATNVYTAFPEFATGRISPLTPDEIDDFQGKVLDGAAGASKLTIPQPGFLRKRDKDNNIGDYYGKADMRLEMFPKRPAGTVPFDFTAIKDGGTGGICSGLDIPSDRQGDDVNRKCTKLNEGQLRSLQQPVMVKVTTDEERTRFCPASVTVNYMAAGGKDLRALQVAIAAQNIPVSMDELNAPLQNTARLNSIATTLVSTLDNTKSPNQLAAAKGACFLAAPIQTLTGGGPTDASYNWNSSYYDRRENRWIGMLQTNIASLTVWNRDGLYVDRDDNLTTNDAATTAQATAAFNSGNPSTTYDTKDLLFVRAAAKSTAPTGSFQKLGLGSADTTEGGLVFYATVSDALGDGSTTISTDSTDNLRVYPAGKKKSPYGFAITGGTDPITGGADLPGALTIVTDRPIYVQGDYNTFGGDAARLPASIIGDVITNLSNACLDANFRINCGITAGQNIATQTSVNAAYLSYTDKSNGNIGSTVAGAAKDYSGGLNNYMRMVENWGGINFNYRGSFVSLGEPQEFSGDYLAGGSSGYYNVPNRIFKYDPNFNAFNLLPPLTPKVIYLQQDTFKRSYK
jgi:hypothetical protein